MNSSPDPVSFGDVMHAMADAALGATADRAPRVPERIGVQREPLPPGMRRAVLVRDRFTCRWCEVAARGNGVHLEIDHIVPWSAGGADHPVNLRTLCTPCNQERSNRVTGHERRAMLIAIRCRRCDSGTIGQAIYVEAFCVTCRSADVAPYLSKMIIGGAVPTTGVPALPAIDYPPIAHHGGLGRALDMLVERVAAQAIECTWCGAAPGEPCVGKTGSALVRSAAHPARMVLS